MNALTVKGIRKRDGRVVPFNKDKIIEAIFSAAEAVGGKDRELSKRLADEVLEIVNSRFVRRIPTVEEVQDIVEKVLIENGHAKTSKAYILYRDQRSKIREVKALFDSVEIVEDYVSEEDWRVKENANMAYSLQGLNNHISSRIIAKYWLKKIYPKNIRIAHQDGDIHLHDLSTLGPYCVGWDLQDLLTRGFGGVGGKIEAAPPKHLRTALGQAVNFLYTLQGESAGAQAFSNFDTLLAPFIRYDKLDYKGIKQALQEFLFNMNVPTRVGFQCLSEDTEILTPNGWVGYEDLKVKDKIKTFNIKKRIIEDKPVRKIFKRRYRGMMYNLKNRIQDQLISPKHRVLRKKFNTNTIVLEEIEEVAKLKSPFITYVAGRSAAKDSKLTNGEIKLLAWIIAEGTIENYKAHRHCSRITIYQSKIKNYKKYKEIISLLNKFKLKYSDRESYPGFGAPVRMVRLNAESSRKIHKYFGTKERIDFIPQILLNMSRRQSRLFLETYLKADGCEGCKIATTSVNILDGLQQIVVNAGYGFTVLTREPTIGTKLIYVLRLVKHEETYIMRIKKVKYDGIIWCPTTENETVIARRNGKVFITGNCPFSNITMDLDVPSHFKNSPVIIGGKPLGETYADFEDEMATFNKAFTELMIKGDAKGRIFSFPIPTYNLTKDFDWEKEEYDTLWKMTAKYGIPYFSNFINSDMKPEDARSMCCRLRLDNKELIKRGGGLFGSNPKTGSVGVVTINMARIGYLSEGDDDFFERLSYYMDIAKQSLELKRRVLERFTEKGLYPYSRLYLDDVKKSAGSYWRNHFSTIGLNGMNEACLNLMGQGIATKDGRKFAVSVLKHMNALLREFQEESENLYNLEATPAEGTSYRFAKIDRERFSNIITAGKEHPYYTNSTHLPVDYTDNLFNALDLQDELQCQYTGGTVFHAFLGERVDDISTCRNLVKKIAHNYNMPYFSLTPTFSVCSEHGYLSGEKANCHCGKPCEVYSRIVGYYRPIQHWNKGKKEEFGERKHFTMEAKV